MEETLFYVLGIALVVVALVLSAVGLRWGSFPTTRGVLLGGIALVGAMVVATGAFAWMNAVNEQDEHAGELAAERQEAFEEQQAEIEAEQVAETGPPPGVEGEAPAGGGGGASAAEGEALFTDLGCGGCHTLQAAGTTGTTGPVLDDSLQGKDEAYISQSIVDPNAEIAQGFGPDIMPQDYGQDLTPDEINALVAYIAQSTR